MMAAAKVMNVAGVCDADASSCYAASSSSSSCAAYFVYLLLVRLLPSSVLVDAWRRISWLFFVGRYV
jgi:hypothetical protein